MKLLVRLLLSSSKSLPARQQAVAYSSLFFFWNSTMQRLHSEEKSKGLKQCISVAVCLLKDEFLSVFKPVPSPADAPHVLAAPICSTVRGIHK